MQPGYLLRNRYRIEKALAAGGFGETYLAVDENPDYPIQRQVVVKHLKPQSNAPGELEVARRLFETEAMTLAKLGESTDRIPTLYAYFEEVGEFYLVQEFIAGTTLTQELSDRQLSEQEMLEILQDVLAGLVKVHDLNVIHRDLKPDNIIRRASNQKLVLIDFGAVKAVRQATTFVVSETIGIGTPGYTPGEQGIGKPQLASDIYAVGAIALQCLTGTHPYDLLDDVTSEFKWQDQRSVSAPVAQMLNQMVAVRHVDRFANARMAKEAVDRLLATMGNSPPQQSPPGVPPVIKQPPLKPVTPTTPAAAQQPAAQPVPPPALQKPVGRKSFLKWLGFGGAGVFIAWLLSLLNNNRSTNTPTPVVSGDSTPGSGFEQKPQIALEQQVPKLTVVQFAAVKLNNRGQIVERSQGGAEVFTENLGNNVSLAMVKIPAGKFSMGSPENEEGRSSAEGLQHQVKVPEFYLGQTLITQAQWQAIMGSNPSQFKGVGKLPVDSVSWLDAMEFCDKLSAKVGRSYRLPSEAEWEYACRAGTITPFAFGETITPAVVNYNGNKPYGSAAKGEDRQKTTLVGSLPPNDFGLYDMHGNLWEWCLDEWLDNYSDAPSDGSARGDSKARNSDKYRLLRGGSWRYDANDCRSASRDHDVASLRYFTVGLRVVGGLSSTPSRQSS